MLAVAEHAETLYEPTHGHVAALVDHALVDLVPVAVDDLVAVLVVGEHVGKIKDAHGRAEHRHVVDREGRDLDDALLDVLKAAFLAAELTAGVNLDFDLAVGRFFHMMLEVEGRGVVRLLDHGA